MNMTLNIMDKLTMRLLEKWCLLKIRKILNQLHIREKSTHFDLKLPVSESKLKVQKNKKKILSCQCHFLYLGEDLEQYPYQIFKRYKTQAVDCKVNLFLIKAVDTLILPRLFLPFSSPHPHPLRRFVRADPARGDEGQIRRKSELIWIGPGPFSTSKELEAYFIQGFFPCIYVSMHLFTMYP